MLAVNSLGKNLVVETVVTGNRGPKASKEIRGAGVKVFFNAQGSVRLGELPEAWGPNVPVFRGR